MDVNSSFHTPPPPIPASAADTHRPVLSRLVSAISLLICAGLAFILVPSLFFHEPFDALEDPIGTLLHVAERDLDINHVFQQAGPVSRLLFMILSVGQTDTRGQILDAYARLDEYLGQWSEIRTWGRDGARPVDDERSQWAREISEAFYADPLYWRYALLAADAGRDHEALAALDKFNALFPDTRFVQFLPGSLQRRALDPAAGAPEDFLAVVEEDSDWSSDEVRIRAAQQSEDASEVEALEAQRMERGLPLYRRCVWVSLGWTLPVLAGAGFLCVLGWRRRASRPLSGGLSEARWSMGYGAQVLVRTLALAVMLFAALPESALLWGTLWTGLPMLLLMEIYLARPDGRHVWTDLGLRVPVARWPALMGVTLAVIAMDQAGAMAIGFLTQAAGIPYVWEEALDETVLFGGTLRHSLSMIDGVLWAPLFEEIAFRGLLYITLRRRLRPVPAALAASALFSGVHLYSLVGFLEIFWSGLVLSYAYERWRSLWPCIAAHVFHNLIYFVIFSLLYRVGPL